MLDHRRQDEKLVFSVTEEVLEEARRLRQEQPELFQKIAEQALKSTRADPRTLKLIIEEFSGTSIRMPGELFKDLQFIEKPEIGMHLMFVNNGDEAGVMVCFHIPRDPGEIMYHPLSVKGLKVRVLSDDGQWTEPEVKGRSEGFLFRLSPGGAYRLMLSTWT